MNVRATGHSPPTQHADLALILKTLPCLEQLDKTAGQWLLEAVNVDYLLLSFPVYSLGGRDKHMLENYGFTSGS
jgi:16S rRNA (guanine(1405)-N(7))-methyltransferase